MFCILITQRKRLIFLLEKPKAEVVPNPVPAGSGAGAPQVNAGFLGRGNQGEAAGDPTAR